MSEIESVRSLLPSIKNLTSMINEIPEGEIKSNVGSLLGQLLEEIRVAIDEASSPNV